MKFTITMKDPDGPYECIRDAAKESLASTPGLAKDEQEALMETRIEKIHETTRRFFRYGEYVDLEIDTEAGTCTVIPVTP